MEIEFQTLQEDAKKDALDRVKDKLRMSSEKHDENAGKAQYNNFWVEAKTQSACRDIYEALQELVEKEIKDLERKTGDSSGSS